MWRELDLAIRVHGFARVGVEDPSGPGWTYTLGLMENFDHPDLVCIEVEPDAQRAFVQAVGAMVVDDDAPPDPVALAELDLELVPVDPCHLRGDLVAWWIERHGRRPDGGDFLQVLPGPSYFCERHATWARRLDDPRPLVGLCPNRAERRARRRAGRRRGRP